MKYRKFSQTRTHTLTTSLNVRVKLEGSSWIMLEYWKGFKENGDSPNRISTFSPWPPRHASCNLQLLQQLPSKSTLVITNYEGLTQEAALPGLCRILNKAKGVSSGKNDLELNLERVYLLFRKRTCYILVIILWRTPPPKYIVNNALAVF